MNRFFKYHITTLILLSKSTVSQNTEIFVFELNGSIVFGICKLKSLEKKRDSGRGGRE